jgi:5-hydroxyisourate hydrolase
MISTHILDTTLGQPAIGVKVFLYWEKEKNWELLETEVSNSDGRIQFKGSITETKIKNTPLNPGHYKLVFEVKDYFLKRKLNKLTDDEFFFHSIPIQFVLTENSLKLRPHFHVPLLLNPYGYSTYRGS